MKLRSPRSSPGGGSAGADTQRACSRRVDRPAGHAGLGLLRYSSLLTEPAVAGGRSMDQLIMYSLEQAMSGQSAGYPPADGSLQASILLVHFARLLSCVSHNSLCKILVLPCCSVLFAGRSHDLCCLNTSASWPKWSPCTLLQAGSSGQQLI